MLSWLDGAPTSFRTPLAKRLRGIEVAPAADKGAEPLSFGLFEGATSGGVHMSLLDGEATPAQRAQALAALVSRLDDPPDLVCGLDATGILAAQAVTDASGSLRRGALLVEGETLQALRGREVSALRKSLGIQATGALDQLQQLDVCLALQGLPFKALFKSEAPDWLATVGDAIDTTWFSTATAPGLRARFDAFDQTGRREVQAALRLRLELEASETATPLVYWPLTAADDAARLEALSALVVAQQAQCVFECGETVPEGVAALLEAHPGRMAVLRAPDAAQRFEALAGCDLLLNTADDALARGLSLLALRCGCVPVLTAHADGRLLELASTGESGHAVCAESAKPRALAEALGRGLYALHTVPDVAVLRRRLMQLELGFEPLAYRLIAEYQRSDTD